MHRNGATRLAVCGKGGSGKTTVAGILARAFARRGRRVLAIDADSNPNLGLTLGIPRNDAERIQPIPRTLLERRIEPDGSERVVLTQSPDEIIRTYGVKAPDDVTLLLMGRVDHAGAG